MKKTIFTTVLFFIAFNFCVAANEMKYVDETKEYYIIVDKDEFKESEYIKNGLQSIYLSKFSLPSVIYGKDYENVYITTYENDEVLTNTEKWWSQLTVCVTGSDYGILNKILSLGGVSSSVSAYAFTDVSNSKLAEVITKNYPQFGLVKDNDIDDYINWYEGFLGEEVTNCMLMTPYGNVKPENLTEPCLLYDNVKDDLDDLLEDFDKKNSSEKIKTINDYNKLINQLKSACESITKNLDANTTCINRCFNEMEEDIAKYDQIIGKSNSEQICGFSARLIHWIANIIRWVKYIIPVVVIVLGILDFMKAMSADKDDEMKKAQQRFIRRLIAAALIFIAPFIIEFVLDKLGFSANGCGIINL